MRHVLTLLIATTITTNCFSQVLTLQSENRTKTFPSLHELTIYVSQDNRNLEYFCYNGELMSVSKDSITLHLSSWIHNMVDSDENQVMHEHHYKNSPNLPDHVIVAKKEIYEIQDYKSSKKATGRRVRSNIGKFILFGSMFTFASSFMLDSKKDRRDLHILSAVSFGTAIILGGSSGTPEYDTRNEWQLK